MASLPACFPWTPFAISWPTQQDEEELRNRKPSRHLLLDQLWKDPNADMSFILLPEHEHGSRTTVLFQTSNKEALPQRTKDLEDTVKNTKTPNPVQSRNIIRRLVHMSSMVDHELNLEEMERTIHFRFLTSFNGNPFQAVGPSKYVDLTTTILTDANFLNFQPNHMNTSTHTGNNLPTSPSSAYSQWSDASSASQSLKPIRRDYLGWRQWYVVQRKTTDAWRRPTGADPVPKDSVLFLSKKPIRQVITKSRLRSSHSSYGICVKKNDEIRPPGIGNINKPYRPEDFKLQIRKASKIKQVMHGHPSKRHDPKRHQSEAEVTSRNSEASWATVPTEYEGGSVQSVSSAQECSNRPAAQKPVTPHLLQQGLPPAHQALSSSHGPYNGTGSRSGAAAVPSSVSPALTHHLPDTFSTRPNPPAFSPCINVVDDNLRTQLLLSQPRQAANNRLQLKPQRHAVSSHLCELTMPQKSTRKPLALTNVHTANSRQIRKQLAILPPPPALKIEFPALQAQEHAQEPPVTSPHIGTRNWYTLFPKEITDAPTSPEMTNQTPIEPSSFLPPLPTATNLQKHKIHRRGAIWDLKLLDSGLTQEKLSAASRRTFFPKAPGRRSVRFEIGDEIGDDDENIYIGVAKKVTIPALMQRALRPVSLAPIAEEGLDSASLFHLPSPVFPHVAPVHENDAPSAQEDQSTPSSEEEKLTSQLPSSLSSPQPSADLTTHHPSLSLFPPLSRTPSPPPPLRSEKHPKRLSTASHLPPPSSEAHPSRLEDVAQQQQEEQDLRKPASVLGEEIAVLMGRAETKTVGIAKCAVGKESWCSFLRRRKGVVWGIGRRRRSKRTKED